ncbi:hypothetical protein [Fictibacillus sp. KU28468]|uniref:hypothetical protein n=1 Tax=Fictibacillus sp. KU28468 TaxID=2991053 RepID=UPI00223DD518|nr:hypothetical protein [Fictibacillus sp. KU28468]UZJ79443.1 hypothetical protein OKX00_02850 [Fictibacillus sp. KU28468]
MSSAKVKINVHTGELEFEDSENFVKEQMDNLESIVDIIAQLYVDETEDEYEETIDEEQKEVEEHKLRVIVEKDKDNFEVSSTFGEWKHKFNDELTDADKALLTAYFVQISSGENEFKTKEVNDTLKEHGIKLTNPSRTLDRLTEKKLTFQVRKAGKIKFLRVSADGIAHLKTLIR